MKAVVKGLSEADVVRRSSNTLRLLQDVAHALRSSFNRGQRKSHSHDRTPDSLSVAIVKRVANDL